MLALSGLSCVEAGDIQFTEITDSCGVEFRCEPPPTTQMNGTHRWGGLAAADFNRDGFVDLFAPGSGGDHDTLYLNDKAGNFVDVSEAWGLTDIHLSNACAAGDFDGDGWIDLMVGSAGDPAIQGGEAGKYRLYRNLAGTGFEDVADSSGVRAVTNDNANQAPMFATFGDYDLDGDLDLLFGTWHAGNGGNAIYRNDGSGVYTNVTDELGFSEDFSTTFGYSASVVDMDGDLYPEILWVGDHNTSHYYRNNRDGTFTNLRDVNGTCIDGWGMGQAIFDYNNDGMLDWYVTSISYDNPPDDSFNGSTLYFQYAEHLYAEVSRGVGVNDTGWSWAAVAADFDHDGNRDVIVTNANRFIDEFANRREKVFQNLGNGSFLNVTQLCGLELRCEATAVAAFDIEHDGDLDVAIMCNLGRLRVYRNDSIDQGHWLHVTLQGDPAQGIAPDGMQTRVEAHCGDDIYVQYADGKPSYATTGPLGLHFGLADAELVDELIIYWANGKVTVLEDVLADQRLTIAPPPIALIGDLNGDGAVNGADLTIMLSEWGSNDSEVDLDGDGVVGGADLTILLGYWSP